jgi:transcriptional regulator of acetoin/glycerol metabolism
VTTVTDTRTVQGEDASGAERDPTRPQFFLLLERARPFAGGARHSLANIDRVTIGRGPVRAARRLIDSGRPTLALTVPDERISSLHACLERHGAGWRFTDRGSTNGSRINRARASTAILDDGDLVELGQTLFRYRAAVRTPANAPGDVDMADLRGMPASFGALVPWLARDLETVGRIARSDVSVLLLGETGTGKEVLARAIHAESGRRGAFVAVNCGALPAPQIESLLFGHKKGAFSGATQDELGLVRAADGGTLFLDEIGDLPKPLQATLLRVLQEREVVPVGATRAVPIDLRIVAATHRPLGALAKSDDFRSDLLARVSAFTYAVPPLRDRIDDIGVLVAALLRKLEAERATPLSLSADAAQALVGHSWPLNVRELEQCLKVGGVLASDGRLTLQIPIPTAAASAPAPRGVRLSDEEEALRAELVAKLAEHGGNVTHVGSAMGKARTQVQRWLRRFGIDPEVYRG